MGRRVDVDDGPLADLGVWKRISGSRVNRCERSSLVWTTSTTIGAWELRVAPQPIVTTATAAAIAVESHHGPRERGRAPRGGCAPLPRVQ